MDCGVTISDTPQKERVKTLSEACLDRSYCRVALRAPRNDADLSLRAQRSNPQQQKAENKTLLLENQCYNKYNNKIIEVTRYGTNAM